jgi:hypothetical protein
MISQQEKLEQLPEWMDLKATERYACVSERTVRDWIHLPMNPLPAVQVQNGKLLIKRSHFDHWLETHSYRSITAINIGEIVNDVIKDMVN